MSFFNLPKVDLARPSSSSSSINNASDESTPLIKTNDEEKANIGIASAPSTTTSSQEQTKKPLFISILTILISIPALVVLIASLSGIAVSAGSVTFAHAITYAITLTILTNLAQYHFHKCTKRPSNRGHWSKFGPFYLTAIAVPLATFDILRHILVDNSIWTIHSFISPAAYRPGCENENITCLSVMGWFSAIVFTYTGYACLLVGTIWAADLIPKIRKAWAQLRPSKN
ncbi:hypothetical protein ACTFIV_002035 [Dictyostelium citrinum]